MSAIQKELRPPISEDSPLCSKIHDLASLLLAMLQFGVVFLHHKSFMIFLQGKLTCGPFSTW